MVFWVSGSESFTAGQRQEALPRAVAVSAQKSPRGALQEAGTVLSNLYFWGFEFVGIRGLDRT